MNILSLSQEIRNHRLVHEMLCVNYNKTLVNGISLECALRDNQETFAITKITPPQNHNQLLARRDLLNKIGDSVSAFRLTLVSAPAGYGKTTLLASLSKFLPNFPLAWLTLDEDDNDPILFLMELIQSIKYIFPQLDIDLNEQQTTVSVPMGGGASWTNAKQVVVALINAISKNIKQPFCLVLDDLHEIKDPIIFQSLDYLISHMPEFMHLAIATRYDPPLALSRYRVRQQICEFHMSDLRFNRIEAAKYLNDVLNLDLDDIELYLIDKKTEGWPAGIVLLIEMLSHLSDTTQRNQYIQRLAQQGSNLYIFLAEEVLNHQTLEMRQFLLQISVLSEFSPRTCDELTNRMDSARLLSELCQRNLIIPASPETQVEPVFRYHSLFGEFLSGMLKLEDAGTYQRLHARAAQIEHQPRRIIAHYLAAELWVEAAHIIEQVGTKILQQGMHALVISWIQALPNEIVESRSELLYLAGQCALIIGDLAAAQQSMELALSLVDGSSHISLRGEILTNLASLAWIKADFDHCSQLADEASQYELSKVVQVNLLMVQASLMLMVHSDWKLAESYLRSAFDLVKEDRNSLACFIFSLYLGQEFTVLPSVMDLLEHFCDEMVLYLKDTTSPQRLAILDVLGFIHLRRGQMDKAIFVGQEALYIKRRLGGYQFLGMNSALTVASAYLAKGELSQTDEFIRQMLSQIEEIPLNSALTGGGLYFLGKLRFLQGQYEEAEQIYQRLSANQMNTNLSFTRFFSLFLKGLIQIGKREFAKAETVLLEAAKLEKQEQLAGIYGSSHLLLSYLYYQWGRSEQALEEMTFVLRQCERANTPGVILMENLLISPVLVLAAGNGSDYARTLLDILGVDYEQESPSEEILTQRQMEVLVLIAAGASNKEIGEKLTISLPTVKSHIVNIMNKLGVSSRTAAVAHARELGLL
jgi:LuxR family maltose regulon positive regulatory protein